MKIRKPTQIIRVTASQEAQIILKPEENARPLNGRKPIRCVQVLIPETPQTFVALDATPEQIGPNRNYKVPFFAPNTQVEFRLLPEQFITALAGKGYSEITVIVEYTWEDE